MEIDERETLSAVQAIRNELIEPGIASAEGRLVKTTGDGFLIEFKSAVAAVGFGIELQLSLAARNERIPPEKQVVIRVGINVGDIIVDGDDIHGDVVNVAARLQERASPGAICVSQSVYDVLRGAVGKDFADGGELELKNIARPIHVWHWSPDGQPLPTVPPSRISVQKREHRKARAARERRAETAASLISRHRDELLSASELEPFIVFLCGPTLAERSKPSAQLRQRLKDALESEKFEVVLGEDDGLEDSRLAFSVNAQDNELEFISTSCNAVIVIADSVGSFCELGLFSWHFVHEGGLLNKTRQRTEFILLIDRQFESVRSYLNEGPARAVDSYGVVQFVDFSTFDVGPLIHRMRGRRGVMIVDNKRGRPRKVRA